MENFIMLKIMKLCNNPFESLEFDANLMVKNCCGVWTSVIRKVEDMNPWEMWNCPEFVELRKRVLVGDYSSCHNLAPCAKLQAGHLKRLKPHWKPVMETGPKTLLFETGETCNLCCPQCRKYRYKPRPNQSFIDAKMREICIAFLHNCEWLTLNCWGDLFVQEASMQLLQSIDKVKYPKLKIEIYTNGILLPKKWHLIVNSPIDKIQISIDAATKETYEQVRLGGKWEDLLNAIDFVKELRQNKIIQQLQFNFCVQTLNYCEIPAFLELAWQHRADIVHFAKLVKLWHHSEEWFEQNTAKGEGYEQIKAGIPKDPRIITTTLM
jgi:sulfatase maturation enzyme AslB (radical SAM superfamily)